MNTNSGELAASYIRLIPLLHRKFDVPAARKTASELTHLQYHILEELYHQREGMSMTRLASRIHVSKQQLTPLMSKLEEKKYVVKQPDERDKRQIGLELTAKGELTVTKRWETFHQGLSKQLERLSEEDRNDLGYCLGKMAKILGRLDDEDRP
ncbi:MarR family transcriptional regulator [Paenibacillus sp. VCA1]|uniref:MarR family winged helix-turn-helix transcriptional regulator n=1 Tax=Paenibacillus sp. VCA1 TaxID=3039148 RepID=UPI002872326D|nr:MarR family transcriptional regulator [Paenibacillus sp. VCA1]MDR9856241.1 MarR family transcriptional regulator [Paenibacillus sp. VCA1]